MSIDDRLDGQGPCSVVLGEMDQQLDVEGLVEGRHLADDRPERGPVEGLETGLGIEHMGQGRDQHGPDEMPEQDDDLVGLVAGTVRLGDRPLRPDQHRPLDPVTLAERGDHLVPGHHRRRQRAQLGQVRGQVRVGVADHMAAGAIRPRRTGPDRGGQPSQDRSALTGLVGRCQLVECGTDRDVAPDHLGQPEHRHAAVTFRRIALGRRDVRHEVGTRGLVRAAVVAGDDAPCDAGQAAGQPVELADLGPHEVLPVRVDRTRDHAPRLAVHGPHHGEVDRTGELAQPPPRTNRGRRFGCHRRTVAARDAPRLRAAVGQRGGRVEHRLVLIRVRQVTHGCQRLVHGTRMPAHPAPEPGDSATSVTIRPRKPFSCQVCPVYRGRCSRAYASSRSSSSA